MKKRILTFICICGMAGTLFACGDDKENISTTPATETTVDVSSEETTTQAEEKEPEETEIYVIKTMREYIYNGDGNPYRICNYDSEGKLTDEKHYFDSGMYYSVTCEYDEEGRLIKENSNDDLYDGKGYTVYEYDENGNLAQKIYRHEYGFTKYIYSYSATGKLLDVTTYNDDGFKSKLVYEYVQDKKIVYKYKTGQVLVSVCEYDSEEHITKEINYSKDGSVSSEYDYEYNEYGDIKKSTLKRAVKTGTSEEVDEYSYEYDKYGNKVKSKRIGSLYEDIYENEYDDKGRLIRCTTYSYSEEGGKQKTEMVEYDYYGEYETQEETTTEKTTVIFHYQREDGNYEGWEIFYWLAGDGVVEFEKEDSFGKIAILKLDKTTNELGFIVKLEDWSEKEGEDRFITQFVNGVAEIWIYSGKEEFSTKCPTGYKPYDGSLDLEEETKETVEHKQIKINVHYYRPDENYSGWDVYMWEVLQEGTGIPFSGSDEFGKIATTYYSDENDKIGVMIRRTDWSKKDIYLDRFIDMAKSVNGVLDVWLVFGDETIYYEQPKIDKNNE